MQQNYEFLVKSGNSEPFTVKFSKNDSKMLDELLSDFPDVNLSGFVRKVTLAYMRAEDNSGKLHGGLNITELKDAIRYYLAVKQETPHYGCVLHGRLEGKKMEVSKKEVEKMKKLLGIAE